MEQRIVCAAIRNWLGDIVCGARHFDTIMRAQIKDCYGWENMGDADQGFIDQHGKFLNRRKAWVVAEAAGQILRRVGGDTLSCGTLFSENLY